MKKVLIILALLLYFIGNVCSYPVVENLTVEDTDRILNYSMSYYFNVSIYGVDNASVGNISTCTINGVSMTGPSDEGDNGTGLWNYTGTINSFMPDMADNCTYTNITVVCTLDNGSTTNTSNATFIGIPCVESTNVSLVLAAGTADTLIVVINNTLDSSTVIWTIPQYYNSSHGQCNYNISNSRLVNIANISVNLTSAIPYCTLTVTRDSNNTGSMVVMVSPRLSITQPSSVPAAAIAALTVILIFTHILARRVST